MQSTEEEAAGKSARRTRSVAAPSHKSASRPRIAAVPASKPPHEFVVDAEKLQMQISLPRIVESNRMLQEASRRIEEMGDYEGSLAMLAGLGVPELADWCAIHLFRADGELEHFVVATADAGKEPAARAWLEEYLPWDKLHGWFAMPGSSEPMVFGEDAALLDTASGNGYFSDIPHTTTARSFLVVPLPTYTRIAGTLTLVLTDSGRRFSASMLPLAVNFANRIALLLDKARLASDAKRLQAELEQRVSERTAALRMAVEQLRQSKSTVQTLFRVSEKLNATLDIDVVLDTLAREAIQMIGAESGFAGLREGNVMRVHRYFRDGEPIPFEHSWQIGEGMPGWVLQEGLPYVANDALNDAVMMRDLPINADVRSAICTPILDSNGNVLGFFDIRNKRDGTGFSVADEEMLLALSSIAAIAIQHALAYEQRVQTEIELSYSAEQLRALSARLEDVREEERAEISRELHDQLGQALTALKLDLAQLTTRLAERDPTLAREAKSIVPQVDAMVKTVRRIATDLRPGVLDNLGLAASLEWQAREFRRRTGIICNVSAPEQRLPLTPTQRIALFRICQEALTNVARHAQAKNVQIELTSTDKDATLRITDDGRGVRQTEVARTGSLGLLGMRERVKLLGGTFSIEGQTGKGTTVTVTVPYEPTT